MSASAVPTAFWARGRSTRDREVTGGSDPIRLVQLTGRAQADLALTFADGVSSEVCGYLVEGASPRVRARLAVAGPFWEPLLDCALLREGGPPFALPHGVVGAGCGLAFVLGRTFPAARELVTREALASALVTCHLVIQVLGHSGPGPILMGSTGRAVNVALRLGPSIPRWHDLDVVTADLRVSLDGNVVAQSERDRNPVDAALWLAHALVAQDRVLEAGHIIATGSRMGILQVLPGQTITARGSQFGGLALTFA